MDGEMSCRKCSTKVMGMITHAKAILCIECTKGACFEDAEKSTALQVCGQMVIR